MSINKEKTYKYIQKQSLEDQKEDEDNDVETKEASNFLNIKRPNASVLLNQPIKEDPLKKLSTCPAHYYLSGRTTHTAFDDVIGGRDSLSEVVKQAKAVINFPGGAFPIHIIATSGSGTTYFPKISIRYAKGQKIILINAPYHEINCRLLEDRPVPLNGELFGKNDSNHFISKYKNNVIMVNHHEKLDTVRAYRINHVLDQIQNKTDNLIILSTTPENKNKINLPIKIELPSFDQKPISEKLVIIEAMFEK